MVGLVSRRSKPYHAVSRVSHSHAETLRRYAAVVLSIFSVFCPQCRADCIPVAVAQAALFSR